MSQWRGIDDEELHFAGQSRRAALLSQPGERRHGLRVDGFRAARSRPRPRRRRRRRGFRTMTRRQTQMALAMFEALNAIDRRYESYLDCPAGDPQSLAGRRRRDRRLSGSARPLPRPEDGARGKLCNQHGGGRRCTRARNAGRGDRQGRCRSLPSRPAGIDPAMAQVPYLPAHAAGSLGADAIADLRPYLSPPSSRGSSTARTASAPARRRPSTAKPGRAIMTRSSASAARRARTGRLTRL